MPIVFGTGTAQTVSMMNPYDRSGDALACVFMAAVYAAIPA